ncbi:MAG TPA: S-adenosylmethionine decarboxylase [Pyrinomonadaceae bacterium]|nr:S-adenosylmethionine decarboxylase [Pyrinomonadaceae bacterium]
MLIVGTEWLVEASGCDAERLRDAEHLRALIGRVVRELDLRVVGEGQWHKFPGEGGVTGLLLLSESHLACHTYPELQVATFNLYCCRARPRWPWEERLAESLGAAAVTVREFERAAGVGGDGSGAELCEEGVGGAAW